MDERHCSDPLLKSDFYLDTSWEGATPRCVSPATTSGLQGRLIGTRVSVVQWKEMTRVDGEGNGVLEMEDTNEIGEERSVIVLWRSTPILAVALDEGEKLAISAVNSWSS